MAQGPSTEIISMIAWIRTSRLSIKNSLFLDLDAAQCELVEGEDGRALAREVRVVLDVRRVRHEHLPAE